MALLLGPSSDLKPFETAREFDRTQEGLDRDPWRDAILLSEDCGTSQRKAHGSR